MAGASAAMLLGVPTPLPLPTAVPTPNLPVVLAPPAAPSVAAQPTTSTLAPSPVAPSPVSAPSSQAGAGAGRQQPPTAATAPAEGNTRRGASIPFTTIHVDSPFDIALIGALATLPLLLGIWLLLFGRALSEAGRARDAQVRLMLAADLGLPPRDLSSMSTRALFDLREKSAFDELTGVLRRAAGVSAAEREIARARRHNTALSVAFMDLDGLKAANDAEGHSAGDALLRGLAEALKDGLRGEDVLFRWGGDEFACVLPETTAKEARARLGEIQDEVAKSGIRFCGGVAQLQRSDDVVSLFARADRDLYEFKASRGEIVRLPTPSSESQGERTIPA